MTSLQMAALEDNDGGLTLVEALVALAISGFVIVALGNLIWFVLGQQRRLSVSEADVQEAYSFVQTTDRLAEGLDPRGFRLDGSVMSLMSAGLPQSAAPTQPEPVRLTVSDQGGLKRLSMTVSNQAPGEASYENAREQPLLTMLTSLSIQLHANGAWLDSWQGSGASPDQVRFTWQRLGGPVRSHVFAIKRRFLSTACLRDSSSMQCGSLQ